MTIQEYLETQLAEVEAEIKKRYEELQDTDVMLIRLTATFQTLKALQNSIAAGDKLAQES